MEVFTFILPDLPDNRTIIEVLASRIELHDEYLIVVEDFYADFKDKNLSTVSNELRKQTDYQLRSKIAGCRKHWYCISKVWGVEINMMGVSDNVNVCFKRESQAQELCDAIMKWLLK